VGEFGFIAGLPGWLPRSPRTLVGIGDDAAVLATPDGRVVATTDFLLEGRHFRRDWSTGRDVGHKAAARSLADVAAMGAVPTALLVALAAPGDLPVSWARELLGANGILLDYQVACYFADAEALYSYEGTREMNTLIVGKAITGFSAFV